LLKRQALKNNSIKELVVLSGKGGTGKTTLTAAIASLVDSLVLADCDVDAADLHLLTQPKIIEQNKFIEGKEAIVNLDKCSGCVLCASMCRFDSFKQLDDGRYTIIEVKCEGCGLCVHYCPEKAIDFVERDCGTWMVSETRFGPMVHARLKPAGENSGQLVSLVRKEARKIAQKEKKELILVDGPPGIGCPVISSVTGSSAVLLVTESTLSGLHDLSRVVQLAKNFEVPVYVVINRADINMKISETIKKECERLKANFVGMIPFDKQIVSSQLAGQSVIEYISTETKNIIKDIWERIWTTM
jgi:MinD superfamily P-loop ATPase